MKLIWFPIIIILFSCSPSKKIARIIDKNPELKKVESIVVRDTVIIQEVKIDTLVKLEFDTVIIRKDNLIIKTVVVNDSIWIEGKCETDTIYRETIIEVEKIVYVKENGFDKFYKKYLKRYIKWFVLFLFLVLLLKIFNNIRR